MNTEGYNTIEDKRHLLLSLIHDAKNIQKQLEDKIAYLKSYPWYLRLFRRSYPTFVQLRADIRDLQDKRFMNVSMALGLSRHIRQLERKVQNARSN